MSGAYGVVGGDKFECCVCGVPSDGETYIELEMEDQIDLRFPICDDSDCALAVVIEVEELRNGEGETTRDYDE